MEPVSSTTFIKRPPPPARGEETLYVARDILLNRLFLGNYVERRHVSQIKDYRDVITISTAETELISDLEKIRHNIYRDCGAKWVGITGPEFENAPTGYCLWVNLTNIPFGRFWFQIKQIKRESEEIIFRLKCIRSARTEDYEDVSKDVRKNMVADKKNCNEGSSEYAFEFDPAQKLTAFYNYLNEAIRQIKPHLTWRNLILATKFVIALGVVLVTAVLLCIQHVGEYILRLIRELAFLLQVITPVLLHGIDCITKAVGGLFILIALFFRTRSPQHLQNQFQPRPRMPLPPQVSSTVISRSTPSNSLMVVPADWRERNRALKMQLLS